MIALGNSVTGLVALARPAASLPPAPAPTPTLSALSLSNSSAAETIAAGATIGTVLGTTAGSTLSLVDNAGSRFALSGGTLQRGATRLDYEAASSHSITIRETLAGATNTPRDTVLSITVTDASEAPTAFTFTDQTGVTASSTQTSNTITVAGLASGDSAPVSISGGTYSKNGGAHTSAATTAVNGDTFAVRHTASASASTLTNTTLTIGGVSDIFSSTTAAGAPPQKIIFEGDSITSANLTPVSMANQWIAANPSVASANLAVASARIRNNGGNSLDERRPSLITAASGYSAVLLVLIGANDLHSASSTAAWQTSLLQYLSDVRADIPGIKIGVGTILPLDEIAFPARAGHNARRATVNAWMRGQVGTTIDFLIPYGDHPEFTNAAASNTAILGDGLHPASAGAGFMLETLNAVLNPIVAGATGAIPTDFAFSDNATATASTTYTERNIITGMGMGQSASATMSGSGDFARGALPGGISYGTSALTVMNGDIITSRLTSDADANDTVTHTVNVAGSGDTWDITTAPNTAVTVFDPARKHASATLQTDRQAYGDDAINAPQPCFASPPKTTGKSYFEMTFYTPPVGGGASIYQVAVGTGVLSGNNRPGAAGYGGVTYRNNGTVYRAGGTTTGLATFAITDTIGVCIDADTDTVWFLKNGVSISGDPVAGTGGYALTAGGTWYPAAVPQREDGHRLNCGQDPFNYTPPIGFVPYG